MNEKEIIYRNTAKVPGEIQDVKNPIIFELSARQLAFVGMAAIATVFTWLITCRLFEMNQTIVIILCLILGSPFLAFGFIRPSNLDLEDWLAIWVSNNIKSAPIRKLSAKNAYELALEHTTKSEGQKTKHKPRTSLKGISKMTQSILDGKINAYYPAKKLFCYRGKFLRIYKIESFSSLSDLGLTNGMNKGYEFEFQSCNGQNYLVIGLNKNSDMYLDFISEGMNTALLLPGARSEAIGIEELTDQLCSSGIYDISIKKASKDKDYLIFELNTSKQLKILSSHLKVNDTISKTLLITGFHNQECNDLITRLSKLSGCITSGIHFKELDRDFVRNAIMRDSSLAEDRKAEMKKFINECESRNDNIFNVCMFVAISGSETDVKDAFAKLVSLCSDECLALYSLSSQQKAAYNAVLPLLNNKITFSRALSGMQLSRLMPVDTFNYEQEA